MPCATIARQPNQVRIVRFDEQPDRVMIKVRYSWIFVAALALGGVLTLVKILSATAPKAPQVEFNLINGGKLPIQGLAGKAVIVNFWATSCQPCLEEIPQLTNLYRELRPQGLEIIGVAMPYDPPTRVLQFSQQHGIPYPIALDVHSQIVRAFGDVSLIPTSFLIAPNGNIVFHKTGVLDMGELRRTIFELLREGARIA